MSFDPEPYAAGIRQANAQERRAIEDRLVEAEREAERLIGLLKDEAGCSEAVVFGSVAAKDVRTLDFDIDIAVWGGDILRAQEVVEGSQFRVDLVEYALAPNHLKKSIDRYRG